MRKSIHLLLIIVLSLMVVAPIATAEDEVPEVVMERIAEYGALIPELDHYNTMKVDGFVELLAENEDVVILDVREVGEVEEFGIIADAVHIPLRTLGENLDLLPDLDAQIVVVCKGGYRATIGMTLLHILGYENAYVLVGGFDAWLGEELPVAAEPAMIEAGEMPDIDPELVAYVADYAANLPEGWGAVKPVDLFEEMFETEPDALIDVRSDEEWAEPGYIEGAQHIWINEFVDNLDALPEDKEANVVIYCASGYRGGIAMTIMGLMGYENVRNMAGGVNGWVAEDLPLTQS